MSLWKNTSTIAFMFASLILSLTIFSLLVNFSRHTSVSLGQLLSRSALVNLLLFRTISRLSFIRDWQTLFLPMTSTLITWAKEPFFLHLSLVAHAIYSSFARMPWPLIGTLKEETFSSP